MLRVTAVGLCGSDLHWYQEGAIGDARLSRPLVLGHEFAGTIADGPRAGQRVVADPACDCGECQSCREGRSNVCTAMSFAGHGTTDGALRTMMAWPERLLLPIPDSIGTDEAPLLEPLGIALHALDLAGFTPGMRAGVYGCGPIGLLLVRLLILRGASAVVATDCLEHRVSAARASGATHAFQVDDGQESEMSEGRLSARRQPVDVAFEVAGSDAALSDAVEAVRPCGRVVLVGIPPGDRTSFGAAATRRKELALLLCRRMMPANLSEAIRLVGTGQVELSDLITSRFPLRRAPEAFAALALRAGVKVVVNPGE
jgi:L-iditol 2-dehydrogenase